MVKINLRENGKEIVDTIQYNIDKLLNGRKITDLSLEELQIFHEYIRVVNAKLDLKSQMQQAEIDFIENSAN